MQLDDKILGPTKRIAEELEARPEHDFHVLRIAEFSMKKYMAGGIWCHCSESSEEVIEDESIFHSAFVESKSLKKPEKKKLNVNSNSIEPSYRDYYGSAAVQQITQRSTDVHKDGVVSSRI